ncbi:hypothetical protein ABIE44_001773 [Marmoricola sp. OAE513]|uniref:hypothetical protein n=1 Tax=Marmoricola sp. OAE513 TaxID=2817894 RepID=UPI001AEB156A
MKRILFRTCTAAAAAFALALSLAACGGDDDSPKARKEARADFKKDAEKICTKAVADIKKLPEELGPDPSQAQIAKILDKVGDGFLAEVAALRKLDPPKAQEKAVEEWLDAFAAAAEETKKKGAKLLDNGAASPYAKPDELARKLGIDGCLSSAS